MKLEVCNLCNKYHEEEEMEPIDGYLYCYTCYKFCDICNRAVPLTEDKCKRCKEKE